MWRAAMLVSLVGACGGRYPDKPAPRPLMTPEQGAADLRSILWTVDAAPAEEPPSEADKMRDAELARLDGERPPQREARPAVDAAMAALDPTEYLRWPLTPNVHPALEPGFAIADALAEPGVSWLDLCAMGAQNRRTSGRSDELAYLRAWCAVAKHDADAAIQQLAQLRYSSIHGIASIVRLDIANVAVDAGDASVTATLLAKAQLDDIGVYDLLAAGYAEIGKTRDAYEMNERAVAANDVRHQQDRCMRLVRRALLAPVGDRVLQAEHLDEAGCARLYHELRCWLVKDCDAYLIDKAVPNSELEFGWLYLARPEATADVATWVEYARKTRNEGGKFVAELTLEALEAGVRSAKCRHERLDELIRYSSIVEVPPELAPRLARVQLTPETLCR